MTDEKSEPPILSCIVIALALYFLFGWFFPMPAKEIDKTSLLGMVIVHTPKTSTILVLPFKNSVGEILLPTRATYLGWGESQYVFYKPELIDEIWARAALIGVYPVDQDEACKDWLWKPMCRRQLFAERYGKIDPVWRDNVEEMKKRVPSLTHVLLPEEGICQGDEILGTAEGHALLSIDRLGKCT